MAARMPGNVRTTEVPINGVIFEESPVPLGLFSPRENEEVLRKCPKVALKRALNVPMDNARLKNG